MKKSLILLIPSILFLSCRKDSFDPFPSSGASRLSSLYYEDEKFYEYEYDSRGRLTVEKGKFHYHEYQYPVSSKTVSKKIYLDQGMFSSNLQISTRSMNRTEWVNPANTPLYGTQIFKYDKNNRLVRSSALTTGHSEYEYDSEGRMSSRKIYHNNVLSGSREYQYDVSGNLIRDDQYSISEGGSKVLSSTTEYGYDQQKNPYRYQAPDVAPGPGTNLNNVIREKYVVSSHPDAGKDVSYTYEYNSEGYPVSRNDGIRYVYKD